MSDEQITAARDVVDGMSFTQTDQSSKIPLNERWSPPAPMPAAPPPPPPSSGMQFESYQSTTRIGPTIINYETTNVYEPKRPSSSSLRGDVLIRPNTGQTNSADGDSFAESVWKMRVANLAACFLAILLEIPNFLGHVFSLQPARAILGIYLSFFAGLLCCFEFHNPWTDKIIQDQFGVLNHPIGRSFILLLMGGLAIGQATLFDFLLGLVFGVNAILTTYAFIRYPEYRRQTEEQSDIFQVAKSRAAQYAWANPAALSGLVGGEGEREGLMRGVG
jgi:hypothetical protein